MSAIKYLVKKLQETEEKLRKTEEERDLYWRMWRDAQKTRIQVETGETEDSEDWMA